MAKPILLSLIFVIVGLGQAAAFCGFYVAQAGAQLYNRSSQVIFARSGDRSVVTMASDYSGPLKDFAMVVPVPEVIKRSDIRIIRQPLFRQLDAYSAPRLVEYHDPNPCQGSDSWLPWLGSGTKSMDGVADAMMAIEGPTTESPVSVEAEYQVGQYDILILSSEESEGLVAWLKQHNYQLPPKAQEVLRPYIQNEMKFFVVKVNLEKAQQNQSQQLDPLQIAYHSDQFMLPIRLGMANAKEKQDLTVYLMTEKGRVRATNYPTRDLPTDTDLPEFVQEDSLFASLYPQIFANHWQKQQASVFTEYAWPVDMAQLHKACDPCPNPPPAPQVFANAGAFWLDTNQAGANRANGHLFFTRLHLRYDRQNFPQDLQFAETGPEKFQCRYVINHVVPKSQLNCSEALPYLHQVRKRRQKEIDNLKTLAGNSTSTDSRLAAYLKPEAQKAYINEYEALIAAEQKDLYWYAGGFGLALLGAGFAGWYLFKKYSTPGSKRYPGKNPRT